jgi:hypothetical protein
VPSINTAPNIKRKTAVKMCFHGTCVSSSDQKCEFCLLVIPSVERSLVGEYNFRVELLVSPGTKQKISTRAM